MVYMLKWLGYIDGIHVTVYSNMDPMGICTEYGVGVRFPSLRYGPASCPIFCSVLPTSAGDQQFSWPFSQKQSLSIGEHWFIFYVYKYICNIYIYIWYILYLYMSCYIYIYIHTYIYIYTYYIYILHIYIYIYIYTHNIHNKFEFHHAG